MPGIDPSALVGVPGCMEPGPDRLAGAAVEPMVGSEGVPFVGPGGIVSPCAPAIEGTTIRESRTRPVRRC